MPRLPAFLRRHPGLQIECLVMTRISDMHASGVDILLQPGEPPASGVVARKIAQTRYGVYAAPAYVDSFGERATPEDLLRHRCLVHQPPFMNVPWDDWEFERDGERRNVKVARTLVTDDREGLFAAALAGAGVIRSAMFDPQLIMSGRLRKLLRDWRCPDALNLYAIHRKAPRLPPKITAFLAFVAEAFADFDPGELTLIHVPLSGTRAAGAPAQR